MTQCFIFLFANETKGIFCVFDPVNSCIQPKTSQQSNLSITTADQIGELFRNRPGRCFFKGSLSNIYIYLGGTSFRGHVVHVAHVALSHESQSTLKNIFATVVCFT